MIGVGVVASWGLVLACGGEVPAGPLVAVQLVPTFTAAAMRVLSEGGSGALLVLGVALAVLPLLAALLAARGEPRPVAVAPPFALQGPADRWQRAHDDLRAALLARLERPGCEAEARVRAARRELERAMKPFRHLPPVVSSMRRDSKTLMRRRVAPSNCRRAPRGRPVHRSGSRRRTATSSSSRGDPPGEPGEPPRAPLGAGGGS